MEQVREVGSRPHVEQVALGRAMTSVHALGGREQRGGAGTGGGLVPRWEDEGVLSDCYYLLSKA